jgi:hypothetical protein
MLLLNFFKFMGFFQIPEVPSTCGLNPWVLNRVALNRLKLWAQGTPSTPLVEAPIHLGQRLEFAAQRDQRGVAPADCWNWGERGPSLIGSLVLFCLGCSSRPWTKYFFPHRTLFCSIPLSPSPRKLDRQPCWVACLLVCVSGAAPNRRPAQLW